MGEQELGEDVSPKDADENASAAPTEDQTCDAEDDGEGPPDEDAEVLAAIAVRERAPGGLPDEAAVDAMHEPLRRVMEAAILFHDLAWGYDSRNEMRPVGLIFLTGVLEREAERLYRLYHGGPPWDG
ncbi:MAG: hypothetical protein MI755_22920 [Sphingomonadales bacterium]|nr:hypothetical protein [Sphingomonadales bacterium]